MSIYSGESDEQICTIMEMDTRNGTDRFLLTCANIERIAGVPIDHSFLAYKKELTEYGFMVGKISVKEQTVSFERLKRK